MEEVTSHGEVGVMVPPEGCTVNMGTIQDSGAHGEPLELTGEQDVASLEPDKVDKSSALESSQELSTDSYTNSVLEQSSLPECVCPTQPINPSSSSSSSAHALPVLAMAPASGGLPDAVEGERDDINQAWFTTKEDKDNLQEKGVKWRQGMWAKDESDLLRSNISDYCKVHNISDPREVIFKQSKEERKTFYRTVAKGIHRPLFAIYRRVLRMYESGNYVGKYSEEEVQKLKELKKKHGNDWTAIGFALGRSASSVKDRCRLLKEKCTSGKWTEAEEQRLSSAVRELTMTKPGESVTTGILWTEVANMVGTRSEKQCRSKWLNYLNWKESGGKEWNKTDEVDLIKKIYELGVENENEIDWVALADGWASVRSPQWLRSKWWTIKKHAAGAQGMSFQDTVAYLNAHYARNLRHRLDRHDSRYLQISTAEHYPLASVMNTASPLTTGTASIVSSVGHAVTVDGEIFMTREDDRGSDGLGPFEMVQLRALPNTDHSQPTSYIIEPVHCSVTGSAPSYILHQTSSQPSTTKLVRIAPNSGMVRQVVSSQVVSNSQQGNITDSTVLSSPIIVSSLAQISHDSLPVEVTSETLQGPMEEERAMHAGNDVPQSYTEKNTEELLESEHQLNCVSEQELSSAVDQGRGNSPCHVDENSEKSRGPLVSSQTSSDAALTVSQSLEINFSTTDSALYSHSLVPSLVSNARVSSAQIIPSEVVIPQPTLPDHILQSQGDESAFLSDSAITVSSPLTMVAGSLGEVTVASNVSGISSDALIMDGDFRISSDVSETDVAMGTNDDMVLG